MNKVTMLKGLKQLKIWVEGECTLHTWPRSSEMCDCSRPYQQVCRYLVTVNALLMGYDSDNLASVSGKRKRKLLFDLKKKESRRLKVFRDYMRSWTRAESVKPSVESD